MGIWLYDLCNYGVHLNPLRAGLVKDFYLLEKYPYSGHSTLMGKIKREWQDIVWVLKLFDERIGVARRRYQEFVKKGISMHINGSSQGFNRRWADSKHGALGGG
ncbi:MAG: hypothetical protein JRH18_21640 [Deltaproteobacteria bacterium]|nr:hypothetical protein [Deltaproteobacteria bacterium]MBW2154256.1 hypothetical protein [Deltaproteobacteria bacterium]